LLLSSTARRRNFPQSIEEMAEEAKDEVMLVADVDEEDEYVSSFDALESSPDLDAKIADYQTLLQNPRYDEKAVKVKEQCIYR
jgi:hypothetical protein